MNYLKLLSIAVIIFLSFSCNEKKEEQHENLRIAFLADIHLQDVYGKLQDSDYLGLENPKNGQHAFIRSMNAQLHSTRIFNENYFAFLAALDDIVRRDIKVVIFPGDFSDDGQPINIRGLKKILDKYAKKHGINFYAITGNHDPVRPFSQEAGKNDFLGEGGKLQPIMSKEGMHEANLSFEHPTVVSKDIKYLGYKEILGQLKDYGFYPKKNHLYWETPFSNYNYETYNFDDAEKQAQLKNRKYQIPPNNFNVPDVSYLVEPIEGIWLLALDANVYIPSQKTTNKETDANNYKGASVGYNNVLSHKKHLITWIKKVIEQANKKGKIIIPFSHYPMIDFNDDASNQIKNLMGSNKMQLERVPIEDIARIFADAGLKLHFGGHMHINDTGIRKTNRGNTLVNIQIPSLAAYIPAYKLLTIKESNIMEVETIVIDSVPRFNEFFDLYKEEHKYMESIGTDGIWNKGILKSKSYLEYTNWHLKELTRLRFLPNDWPIEIKDLLLKCTGKELFILSQIDVDFSFNEILNLKTSNNVNDAEVLEIAVKKAQEKLKTSNLSLEDFNSWSGFDLVFDFYRVRSADKLAIKDIGEERLAQYKMLFESFLSPEFKASKDKARKNLQSFAIIFQAFLEGEPADNFQLNLETGKIKDLKIYAK